MNIGVVIKNNRQKSNMTQTELAACLNITPQAVSRWEMGISYPDIAMLPRISEVLRVSADELLGIRLPDLSGKEGSGGKDGSGASAWPGEYQECQEPALNQSQADSIFDYVPVPSTGEGKRILVVDDADFMRMMLKEILGRCGHTVLEARNGQECLDILERETAPGNQDSHALGPVQGKLRETGSAAGGGRLRGEAFPGTVPDRTDWVRGAYGEKV